MEVLGCESVWDWAALTPGEGSVRKVGLCALGLLQKAPSLSAQEPAGPWEPSLALLEMTAACTSVPSPALC